MQGPAFAFPAAPGKSVGISSPRTHQHHGSKCVVVPSMTAATRPPLAIPMPAKHKPGTRTPTFRKLQEKQKEGPQAFREKLEQESKDILEAESKAEAAADAKREMKRKRKERRKGATPLSELKVGSEMTGVVRNLVRHGAYVDIGAKRDGLVHVRDMSVDFVHHPEDLVLEGDTVTVWVKYVNTVTNVLGLSMRPQLPETKKAERKPISEIELGKRYEGHVVRITNFGAYVDIGAECNGFLHVNRLWGRRPRETLDELVLGRPIWVVVADVDEIRSHIKLNARGKAHNALDPDGKVLVDEPKEIVLSDPVKSNLVLARPGDAVKEEEEEGVLSDADIAKLLEKDRMRDEHLVKNVGPVAQTSSWDEIRHLFDESTEFVGMDEDSE